MLLLYCVKGDLESLRVDLGKMIKTSDGNDSLIHFFQPNKISLLTLDYDATGL